MENYVTALTFGIFMLSGCSARVVTVPSGPLIRVEGQPVSIRCDVKEYTGPSEQDFEWNMLKDAKGRKTQIISSFDSRYSDQSYSTRVASGDISMVRLQDNEVELKIAEVKLTDAGFYECQTPSTDYVISGNYMAQVQLTVIPNTLKVSPKTPPPVITEGSDLTLSCNVTRELIHPRNWTKIVESTKEMGTVAVTPTKPVILYDSTRCYIVSTFLSLYGLIITSMFIREEFFRTKVKTNQDVNSELEGLVISPCRQDHETKEEE
ncbi:immunoglobulin superfamily member 8-like [Oreochromis aureus]|uniref:immunoglobulin superfamily member 8-like n=1 Tax=Oreochromis aureus TaxID=47969 RepID=UPI001953F608|nr:immunoglobulin superfamily member 8-like [Oreochromis aureus]